MHITTIPKVDHITIHDDHTHNKHVVLSTAAGKWHVLHNLRYCYFNNRYNGSIKWTDLSGSSSVTDLYTDMSFVDRHVRRVINHVQFVHACLVARMMSYI